MAFKLIDDEEITIQPLTDFKLAPKIVAKIESQLDLYTAIKADFDILKRQLQDEHDELGRLLAEEGISNARSMTGAILYWTRGGVTRKLDLTKLVAQGVTTAQIEAATVEKPRKDSFTIRLKGEKHAYSEPD